MLVERGMIKGIAHIFIVCQRALLLPTLHSGAEGLDSGLVCCVHHIGTGLEAGQGFWGDALIVVESEYKGHWNKQPLQLTE